MHVVSRYSTSSRSGRSRVAVPRHSLRRRTAAVAVAITTFSAAWWVSPEVAFAAPVRFANDELTLEEAVSRAFAASPELQAVDADLARARGQLVDSQTYRFNPVLAGSAASRDGGGGRSLDFEIGVAQEVEIAGQRGKRIDRARDELAASRSRRMRAQRRLAARVHVAFARAVRAREIREVARRDSELVENLYDLARRRLERGAGTRLNVNVAAAELGRAQARFAASSADYDIACAALAEAMGLDASDSPRPRGDLSADLPDVPSRAELVESARRFRSDLEAFRKLESASRARFDLARAEAWPNVTIRVFGGHEERTDTLIGGGLSIPIPVFDRNRGGIQQAGAEVARAEANRAIGEIAATREVVAAHARFVAASNAVRSLRRLVVGTLEDSLGLLQRSFEAGKATWSEVIVIRRSLVDARRDLFTAEAALREAWTELQLAAGRMPVPDSSATSEERG